MSDKHRIYRPLVPNPFASLEQAERFAHRDLPRLELTHAWGEAQLIEQRLAELAFTRQRGSFLTVTDDGLLLYEIEWLRERLLRLRARLRGAAA